MIAVSYGAFCLVALGLGTLAGWINQSSVAREVAFQTLQNKPPQEVFDNKSSLTILILGCDENRAPGGHRVITTAARSDMMLLAKLDFERNLVSGMSIPRDTLFALPGYRAQKINAYHAIGGPDLSRRAVQGLLGITIDRVAVLDYESFQEIVDMVGGVEIDVPKRMRKVDRRGDLNIDLRPGLQVLNGYDAMCFVRYRNDSDFMRQQRQKEFILALKQQVFSRPELLPKVAQESVDLLGGEFTAAEVAAIARFARNVGTERILMGMVPVVEASGSDLRVDERRLPDALVELNFAPRHYTTTISGT